MENLNDDVGKVIPQNVKETYLKKDYFHIINSQKKLEKVKSTVIFLQSCKDNNLIPKTFKDNRIVNGCDALNCFLKRSFDTNSNARFKAKN